MDVRVAPTHCRDCGAETHIVSRIVLSQGDIELECGIADFTDYPSLVTELQRSIPRELEVGALKLRHSKTLARTYMSNGCAHCDVLFGQHFEIQTRYDERSAAQFTTPAIGAWADIFQALQASEDGHLFHF